MDSFEQNGDFSDTQESQDTDTGRTRATRPDSAARAEIVLTPDANNVVVLPEGASLETLTAQGRDLVLVLDDGTRVIIPEGAIIVPQIVFDGVTIPAANLAALLTGNEPQPAAGDPQSSGGNFEVDPGNIQAAFDIGDLLPYTQLAFPEDKEREVIPYNVENDPDIVIETPDNPAGVINAIARVDEAGLPARNVDGNDETPGTRDETNAETATGTIVFNAPDGVAAVLINGVEITAIGQVFVGDSGTLTITSINLVTGEIGFSYTLSDNLVGETVDGSFVMTVVDVDGDSATATLQIIVVDDAPIALDDSDSMDAGTYGPIAGNVMTGEGTDSGAAGADEEGADGASVTGVSFGGSDNGSLTIDGDYGTLVLEADGSYTYTRFPDAPGGVSDAFDYVLTDADGSTSSATLTITIGDSTPEITLLPEGEAATIVDEEGLPARSGESEGSDAGSDSETSTGTINFVSPDGVASVTLDGTVITGAGQTIVIGNGTLTVTAFDAAAGTLTYSYTLEDNTSGDDTGFEVELVVTDLDGDTATGTFTIGVIDDVPTANDDSAAQGGENDPVTVDVFVNDVQGADSVQLDAIAAVDGTLSGAGSLAYNGDGTFTYTPAAGETGTVTFDYQITDGDGDVSTATVTITLQPDSTPEISVQGDNDVEESGLGARDGEPEGSNSASDGEIAEGTINIATGGDTIASLVIDGVDVTGGGSVTTTSGVLTVTLTGGVYSYTYELTDNTLSDPDSESFSLTVTDSDGDTASTTLVIAIIDDAPSAEDDANSIGAGEYGPVGGNVLGNDTQGADGASVTSYTGAGGSGAADSTIQGLYGTLTIAADGTYSYTRDADTPGGVEDSFDYVITDGDGDTATATLVISIADSPVTLDLPVAGGAGTLVDEAGLPAGSEAATDGEFTSGTFTYTAPDGPAVITLGGDTVTAVGQTITGSFGTLTITSIADGAIGYTYELTTNTSGDDTFDAFAVTVTDQDGDTTGGTLQIDIVDDVPTAVADTDSVTEDGPLIATGNVITDAEANGDNGADTEGADGALVSAVGFGATSGTVGVALAGAYGSLVLEDDGTYTYELDNQNPLVQGLDSTESLTEVFTYTVLDGDGDTSTTTLTITINGANDIVTINGLDLSGPEEIVDEDDLADGSSPDAGALVQGGTFTVDSPDGLTNLTVGGTAVWGAGQTYPITVTGDFGTVSITGVNVTTDANGDVVSATVSYEYELSDNTLDHTVSGEDSLVDSFEVVATDTDGSQDTASLDVQVIDDVPTANDDAAGQVNENDPIVIDALGNDVFGADGVDITDIASVVVATQGSQGTATYDPATGLFTYVPAPGAGSNGDLTDSFTYTITDNDGDSSTATVTVTLQPDSEPQGGQVAAAVDDDGLVGGNPDSTTGDLDANANDDPADTSEASFTGLLDFSVGNDGPASIGFDPALDGSTAMVGTEMVTYSVSGTTLTATGPRGVLFTVEITDTATGAYTVTLVDNVLHADGADENDAFASLDFTVTDSDGDVTMTNLGITFDDDAPTATNNTNSATEGATVTGNILTDDDGAGVDAGGADGLAGIIGVTSVGTNDSDNTGPFTVSSALGTLTVLADGSYTYQSFANSTNSDTTDTFTYQIIDADGDIAEATLVIDITNVAGQVEDDEATVNEAGLDGIGSAGATDGEIDADGQITVTGAAGPLTYTLTSSATGTYGTLTLDSVTGEYTYTLTAPVDGDSLFPDQGGDNGTNTVTGEEAFTYEVRDDLGNLIGTGTINVDIVDDVPTATDQALVTVAEDAADITGNVMTDGTPDTEGADGATVTAITVGAQTVVVPQDGTDATLVTANGTYTIDMDGNWSFNPNPGLDQSGGAISADFTYTLTDGDGDTDTATQPINIVDGTDPADPAPIILNLDDQNLADGSTPAGPDFDADTINFVPGSDPFTSIVFGDTSGLLGGLTWVRVDDNTITGSDGGRLVVTLELTVNGNDATVTATLEDNYLGHPNPLIDDLSVLGSVDVVATDVDGDNAIGGVLVRVSDDRPTIEAVAPTAGLIEVDETNLGLADSANLSGLFTPDYNADGAGSVGGYTLGLTGSATSLVDTATGEDVVVTMNGSTIEGRTDGTGDLVFTIEVAADGTVTLTQLRAVVHADDTDPDDVTGGLADDLVTLTATVTDGDGDTDTATADIGGAFAFRDDGPAIDATVVDLDTVLLTTQDADTVGGSDTDVSTADFGGAFSVASSSYGADGAGSISWAYDLVVDAAASGLTSDGVDVSLSLVGGVVEGRAGGTLVFTIAVDAGTGVVTLTQFEEIDHDLPGDATDYDNQLEILAAGLVTLRGTATIEDGDGDTASETVLLDLGGNIRFADDGPDVTVTGVAPALIVDETDLGTDATGEFGDVFTFDFGADGPGSVGGGESYDLGISASGADSGLVDTATGNSVFLFLEAGVVVGREGTDALDAATGDTVFTLSVDADGTVTLDQQRAVVHADGTDPDDATGLGSAGLVTLTATATDGDGDTDTATINIGDAITFEDDGPSTDTNPTVLLDDDALGGNAGGTGDDADAANTSGTLAHDFGEDGGSIVFETTGAPAGFQYVTSGDDILIQQDQGSGFVTVLTVTLNTATGAYTVTQNLPILHADGNDENNESFSLTYTVTDGDTDTATGTLTINVDDDTPIANSDTDSLTEGGTATGNVLDGTGTTSGAAGIDQPGADGFGSPAVLGVSHSGQGTSDTTADGGGNYVLTGDFGTLTINEDGSYSYAVAADSITQNETDTFTYTIQDADGDTTTATLTFSIDNVTLVGDDASVTVFEEALDTTIDVGDVAAGSVTGSDPSQTTETSTGQVSVAGATGYSIAGGTSAGGFTTIAGTYGTLVINEATGEFTYTLTAPFTTNPAANDGVTTALEAETFTYTATDANGNTTTGDITVDLVDDVPYAVVPEAADDIVNGPSAVSGPYDLDVDGSVVDNYGADGAGTVRFSPSLDGTDSGLTSSFQTITYVLDDDQTLRGVTTGGDTIFTVTLNPADGTYTVDMDGSIDSTSDITFNPLTAQFVGGNGSWTGFVPIGDSVINPIDDDSQDLLLTPAINGADGGTINSTANSGGVGGGASVGGGETFRVDFVTDLRGNPADSTQNDYAGAANRDHVFDGHYTVNGATALFKSTSGSTVNIAAFDDLDGNNIVGDGNLDTITGVAITYRGVAYEGPGGESLITTSGTYLINGRSFTVTFNNDGTVDVANLEGDPGQSQIGTQIAVFTDDGYNSVEYTHAGGDTFQVGGFGASTITTDPVTWDIPVEVVDGDGDVSTTGDITITASTPDASPVTVMEEIAIKDDLLDLVVNDNDTAGSFGFLPAAGTGSLGAGMMRSEVRTAEMATVAAMASGFAMPELLGAAALQFESAYGLEGHETVFAAQAAPLDLGSELPQFDSGMDFASPVGGDIADAGFEANILSSGSVSDGAPAFFAADPADSGIDYSALTASEFGGAEQPGAFGGLDASFAGASGAMEALLLMEASAAPADIASVDSKATVAEAIQDIAAEAGIDALVSHYAPGNELAAASSDGVMMPAEGLLDAMLQPGIEIAMMGGITTTDQLDEAASLVGSAA